MIPRRSWIGFCFYSLQFGREQPGNAVISDFSMGRAGIERAAPGTMPFRQSGETPADRYERYFLNNQRISEITTLMMIIVVIGK